MDSATAFEQGSEFGVGANCVTGATARRHRPARNCDRQAIVERVREVLRAKYAEPIPLQDIAAMVGLSRFHLSRLFRRETGSSIHREQVDIRLRVAWERIAAGEPDLAALALDLGFCTHSYFTKCFRLRFGVAPSEVRRDLRGSDGERVSRPARRPRSPRPAEG